MASISSLETLSYSFFHALLNASTYDLNRFEVKVIDVQPKSVLGTSIRSAEQVLALFDYNLIAATTLKENQQAGKFLTYDLGQEILIESMKLKMHLII